MIDFCSNALKIYGKTGDQSLECIGINFTPDSLVELRLYRRRSPALLEHISKKEPYAHMLGNILHPFYQRKHIQLCDISRNSSQTENTFRVVFSLPGNQAIEESPEDIDIFFSCFPNGGAFREEAFRQLKKYTDPSAGLRSPLLQIGAEFTENYELKSAKYYMRVPDFHFLKNIDNRWEGLPEQQCDTISRRNYKPIFTGINDTGSAIEEKLYYSSKAIGYKRPEILETQQLLSHDMGWDSILSHHGLAALYQMGLYMGGIALSLQSDLRRLYFKEFINRPKF